MQVSQSTLQWNASSGTGLSPNFDHFHGFLESAWWGFYKNTNPKFFESLLEVRNLDQFPWKFRAGNRIPLQSTLTKFGCSKDPVNKLILVRRKIKRLDSRLVSARKCWNRGWKLQSASVFLMSRVHVQCGFLELSFFGVKHGHLRGFWVKKRDFQTF